MSLAMDSKWVRYSLCIGLLVVGAWATYFAAREIALYRTATSNFLAVEARIISHDLHRIRSKKAGYSDSWMPVISYEYGVGEHVYRSNNVFPRPISGHEEWAQGVLAEFPMGTARTAYYNPLQPEQSYLATTKLSSVYYGALAIGVLFILVGTSDMIRMLWRTWYS